MSSSFARLCNSLEGRHPLEGAKIPKVHCAVAAELIIHHRANTGHPLRSAEVTTRISGGRSNACEMKMWLKQTDDVVNLAKQI